MVTSIVDIDIEMKKKISRIEDLESRILKVDEYMYNKSWIFTYCKIIIDQGI